MKINLKKFTLRAEKFPDNIDFFDGLIATWFGSGLIRPAPGTWGSLAAIPFGYVINIHVPMLSLFWVAILLGIGSFLAVKAYGKASGVVDNQSIVIDEVIGIWIAGSIAGTNLWLWLAAFLLFRFFDILKPWPASYFDRKVKNAFGVIMDDVVAGIYALLGVAIVAAAINAY